MSNYLSKLKMCSCDLEFDIRTRCEVIMRKGSECPVAGDTLAWLMCRNWCLCDIYTDEELCDMAVDDYNLTETQMVLFKEFLRDEKV